MISPLRRPKPNTNDRRAYNAATNQSIAASNFYDRFTEHSYSVNTLSNTELVP